MIPLGWSMCSFLNTDYVRAKRNSYTLASQCCLVVKYGTCFYFICIIVLLVSLYAHTIKCRGSVLLKNILQHSLSSHSQASLTNLSKVFYSLWRRCEKNQGRFQLLTGSGCTNGTFFQTTYEYNLIHLSTRRDRVLMMSSRISIARKGFLLFKNTHFCCWHNFRETLLRVTTFTI